MGLTYKKKDSLEKLFEEFAIDPDKKDNEKAINKSNHFSVNIEESSITMKKEEQTKKD
ncbi:MAG: SPJ_0845 family protein [Vagococcus sp.]